jgi:hypothetical protein
MYSRLPVLLVAAAVSLLVGAGQAPRKQQDAQSTYEPRSQPGAGQKFLKQFVGDWEVIKTFYPRSGAPVRIEGTCHQTMLHDGRFLQSEFVFTHEGARTTGLGLIGFEPESGRFTSVWTDSRQTRMSLRQSQDPFDGKEIVLYSRSLEVEGKEARRSRTMTRLEDDGRKLVHRQYAAGAGGKERLVMELMMTRKGKTSPPGK